MKIRLATKGDDEGVLKLLVAMHDENGMAPIDGTKVFMAIQAMRRDGWIYLAESSSGKLAGSLSLTMGEWWYSTEKFLGDRWLFVHPDYRKTPAACMLIRAAKDLSREVGVMLCLGVLSPVDPDRKSALYLRAGMVPVGGMFLYAGSEEKSWDRSVATMTATLR